MRLESVSYNAPQGVITNRGNFAGLLYNSVALSFSLNWIKINIYFSKMSFLAQVYDKFGTHRDISGTGYDIFGTLNVVNNY